MKRILAATVILGAVCSCSSVSSEMGYASTAYEEARYDDADVWLTELEPEAGSMSQDLRARFFFLRGMTALRLSQRESALYYLAVAREIAEDGGQLGPEWTSVLERSLSELEPGTTDSPVSAEADPT